MDTIIKRGSAGADGLPDRNTDHIVVGTKQLRKALLRGGVARVYLALDADPAITVPLEALCGEKGVSCAWVRKMADLGRACGIDVGAAAAAVTE